MPKGMPKMRGRFPAPLALFLARWWTKQGAIAAMHQGQASLHQADGAAAQFVGLPRALGDAFLAEQHLGDHAIRGAIYVTIERSQRQGQPFAPLCRKLMEGRS